MAQQQRLLINSSDRTTGSTIQRATYELDKPITSTFGVRLDWLQFYNTFFNVTSTTNQFQIGTIGFVLTPGFYTSAALAVAIDIFF